jgi:hypothetical protein
MEAYAHGNRKRVKQILRRGVKYIGRKSAIGKGGVLGIDVEWIDEDFSLTRDGKTVRLLPSTEGTRFVRPRPPYWNNCGRVMCLEVGTEVNQSSDQSRASS